MYFDTQSHKSISAHIVAQITTGVYFINLAVQVSKTETLNKYSTKDTIFKLIMGTIITKACYKTLGLYNYEN